MDDTSSLYGDWDFRTGHGLLRLYYGLAAVIMLAAVGLALLLYSNVVSARNHDALIDATSSIENQTTVAHLWFEEIVSGDTHEEIEQVWTLLDGAKRDTQVLLMGTVDKNDSILPLQDVHLRKQAEKIQNKLTAFHRLTRKRWNSNANSGSGSEIDQAYDRIFKDLIQLTSEVKSGLRHQAATDPRALMTLQGILVTMVALVLVVIGFMLRKHIESSRQSENRLRMHKFSMEEHTILAITDPDGTIIYVNDKFCSISQYSKQQLIGKSYRILKSGYHPHDFFVEMWQTISSGKVWKGEICNRAKDHSTYWVDMTIVPFKNECGVVTQHLSICTDITERKIAEQKTIVALEIAEAANQAKSEFLANMSHELRTPMTAILGFSENLTDEDLSDAQRFDYTHTIQRNGKYLLDIINDILDLSKIEADKMTIERVNCEPCKIIADVASIAHMRAKDKQLVFNIEYDGPMPAFIQSDPTRIRQILINLTSNAIKFTDRGSVRLVTRFVSNGDNPQLQFDIIDTGCGLNESQVNKLFKPFSQADASTTRKYGGTGLGLTISRRLARMLGGDVRIVETEEGVGTVFRASLAAWSRDHLDMLEDPLAATIIANIDDEPLSQDMLHGCRILLAEDGPDNQRLLTYILDKAGATVTIKENGQLALEAALNEPTPFDMILMDMQMPLMDGYEATSMLRAKGYTGKIIALTANVMTIDREKCIKAGCDDYISKPIDRHKLIEAMRQQIGHPVSCSMA